MNEGDHDQLMRLCERVSMTEQQHEREIQRLSRNINTVIGVVSVVVPVLTTIILLRP